MKSDADSLTGNEASDAVEWLSQSGCFEWEGYGPAHHSVFVSHMFVSIVCMPNAVCESKRDVGNYS